MSLQEKSTRLFTDLQNSICSALEFQDGVSRFESDTWERKDTETGGDGGGGCSKILRSGGVFEQGGVNVSAVHGKLPSVMQEKFNLGSEKDSTFFATGVSLVIHPFSPRVPTVHANFRYFEVDDIAWFGGGADLTPYILQEEDAVHFHQILKSACDPFSKEYYPRFKAECDTYFHIPHRKETRGIGGIFFDYLGKNENQKLNHFFDFTSAVGHAFIDAYIPIVEKRKPEKWTEREKEFQLLRRGRYAEFNLVYDRGTQFGLATGGRTESILMSLPPLVRWQYEGDIATTKDEQTLMEVLKNPREWIS
jgi:coproporphyrinogen III oxidase